MAITLVEFKTMPLQTIKNLPKDRSFIGVNAHRMLLFHIFEMLETMAFDITATIGLTTRCTNPHRVTALTLWKIKQFTNK